MVDPVDDGDVISKKYIDNIVGDIETALDSIIAIQEGLIGSGSIISFTIDETSYQAEKGMTWGEWVDSDYNTDGWEIVGSNNIIQKGEYAVYSPGDNVNVVRPSNEIVSNRHDFSMMF